MGRGQDYYAVLGIDRNADVAEIKRGFRSIALKLHPDKDPSAAGVQEFARACEAYDVLINASTKGIYDLHGEEALKAGVPGTDVPAYSFDPQAGPQRVFARFFGTDNPYEALAALSSRFKELTPQEQTAVTKEKRYDLPITLEELAAGCTKLVAHTRKVLTELGEVLREQRTCTVVVRPGMRDGTCFVFQGEGNQTPQKAAGPVVFVLRLQPHPIFTTEGDNLLHVAKVPLYQGLSGTAISISTLDGRVLRVPVADVVAPGQVITVPGEGLPRGDGSKGDLRLELALHFPTSLTPVQKSLVKAAMLLPANLSEQQARAVHAFEAAFNDSAHGWSTGFNKKGQQ